MQECRSEGVQESRSAGVKECRSEGVQDRDVARLKSLQNLRAFRELFLVLQTKTKKFCAIFF